MTTPHLQVASDQTVSNNNTVTPRPQYNHTTLPASTTMPISSSQSLPAGLLNVPSRLLQTPAKDQSTRQNPPRTRGSGSAKKQATPREPRERIQGEAVGQEKSDKPRSSRNQRAKRTRKPQSTPKDSSALPTPEHSFDPSPSSLLSSSKPPPPPVTPVQTANRPRTPASRRRSKPQILLDSTTSSAADEEEDDEDEEEIILFSRSKLVPKESLDQVEMELTPRRKSSASRPGHTRTVSAPMSIAGGETNEVVEVEVEGVRSEMQGLKVDDGKKKAGKKRKSKGKKGESDQQPSTQPNQHQQQQEQVHPWAQPMPTAVSFHHIPADSADDSDAAPLHMSQSLPGGLSGLTRGGKGKKGRDGREREKEREGGDDVWEMPVLEQCLGDGSGMTWQQALISSPTPARSRPKQSTTGFPDKRNHQRSAVNDYTSQDDLASPRTKIGGTPKGYLSADPDAGMSATISGGGKRGKHPLQNGDGADVFRATGEHASTPQRKRVPVVSFTPNPIPPYGQHSSARPAGPGHTVSAPARGMATPIGKTKAVETFYAGPKFHNSPSADMLAKPRLRA